MVFCFLGATEVAIILIVALLVFGPQKLPEVGKQIGSVWREMNRMRNDVERMLDVDDDNNRYDRTPYYTPNETIYPQISGPLEEPEGHETETSENHGEPGGVKNATFAEGVHYGAHEGDGTAATPSLTLTTASEHAVEEAHPLAVAENSELQAVPAATLTTKEDSGASHEDAQERKNNV